MEKLELHPWEVVGLGKYPFKYLGFKAKTFQACQGAPIQAGGSCDYCGTAIVDHFYFRSSDGNEFHVGSSCVKKASLKAGKDPAIHAAIREIKKLARDARHQKEALKIEELNTLLNDKEVKEKLSSLPHSNKFMAEKGKTYLDYVLWLKDNCGNAGSLRLLKTIKKVLKGN